MNGQYIERIEIDGLWNGHKHICWDLQPGVNILSGVNGVGKSTILNRVIMHLLDIDRNTRKQDGVHLKFFPQEAKSVDFEVIRSFDRPMLSNELMNKLTDNQMQTELDLHIYHLGRKWLDYQVNLSNRMVELFASNDPEAAAKVQALAHEKTHFQDLIDDLVMARPSLRTSSQAAKSRCSSYCSPFWCRTANPSSFSWTNQKSLCTSSGNNDCST